MSRSMDTLFLECWRGILTAKTSCLGQSWIGGHDVTADGKGGKNLSTTNVDDSSPWVRVQSLVIYPKTEGSASSVFLSDRPIATLHLRVRDPLASSPGSNDCDIQESISQVIYLNFKCFQFSRIMYLLALWDQISPMTRRLGAVQKLSRSPWDSTQVPLAFFYGGSCVHFSTLGSLM
jgi:hypothetical protein